MRILADARTIPLQSGTVQCVVTSPPYWGLRDYGTARWEGGDAGCDHLYDRTVGMRASTLQGGKASQPQASVYRCCPKCGAHRIDAQIGLEPTPDAYVAALVGVFREVWRVLRDDGTLWLNLGDSYAPNWSSIRPTGGAGFKDDQTRQRWTRIDLAPKNLVGIPWRVAFALQAHGWYLRSDIIWAKPNPMPESVTDRPTKAHEYVFLLTKRERYYYDAEAIAEPSVDTVGSVRFSSRRAVGGFGISPTGNEGRESDAQDARKETRNARSVWTMNPKPYAEAHFATMPEKLAERCILAGSKPGDLVLDPFGGSGTTVRVARRFNRRGVMLDLNPAYLDLAEARTSELQPSLLHLSDEASA